MEEDKIIYSLITFSLFVLLLVIAILLLFLNYAKNKKRLLAENENMKVHYAQALLQTQLEIQEQVFTQISQEIHDNIGQVLSLVRLNINTLNEQHEPEKIETTDHLLGKAIQDLRHLSHTLNSDYITDVGLVDAIRELLASLQRTGQFNTRFKSEAELYDLGDEKTLILFRIVQEAVNNIIRHAGAKDIEACITGAKLMESITIKDNGKGFDTTELTKKGIGISSMKNRAKLVGATLEVYSRAGEGTIIEIKNGVD